jgi:hypothetical protein
VRKANNVTKVIKNVGKEGTQTGKKRSSTGLACTEAVLAGVGILPAKKVGKTQVTQKVRKNTKKVVAYMRTSSKTNMRGDSQGRQLRAILAQVGRQGIHQDYQGRGVYLRHGAHGHAQAPARSPTELQGV